MFIIRKEFAFSASHQLQGLPEEHPCSRLHGHNYVITVELRSDTLNDVGFVRDYRALEPIKKWIDETLDHQHLNDVFENELNPTAECMASFFYYLFVKWVPELHAVEVSETPKTTARYEQSPIKVTNEKS
jgi:6-pyruvoyltetrahydropterin/6-carboxytetrahydropterin synthase